MADPNVATLDDLTAAFGAESTPAEDSPLQEQEKVNYVPEGTFGSASLADIERAFVNPSPDPIDQRMTMVKALNEFSADPMIHKQDYLDELFAMRAGINAQLAQIPESDVNARAPLVLQGAEVDKLLDVEMEAAQRADAIRAGNDVAALVRRFGKDAARDYLALKAGAWGVAKAGSMLPAPGPGAIGSIVRLTRLGAQGLSFLAAGSTMSGLAEAGIELAEDALGGESDEPPTFLEAMGFDYPIWAQNLGLQREAPGSDPTFAQSLLRGYEDFVLTGSVASVPQAVKPLYQHYAGKLDNAVEQMGRAIVGSDTSYDALVGKTNRYNHFKVAVKDLLEGGYLDNMKAVVENKLPSVSQISKFVKGTGILKADIEKFFKETLSKIANLSVGEFNKALQELFYKGLRTQTKAADDFIGHYWSKILKVTPKEAKRLPEFQPRFGKVLREILKDVPAAEKASIRKSASKMINATRRDFLSSKAGPMGWATEEKRAIYARLDRFFGKEVRGTTKEAIYRAMSSELKDYIERLAKGMDDLVYNQIDSSTGRVVKVDTAFKNEYQRRYAENKAAGLIEGPKDVATTQGAAVGEAADLAEDAPQMLKDEYSLPGPTTPIRTDLPAKYKYQVITTDGTEVGSVVDRPRTFEFDSKQGIFVEVSDIPEESTGGLFFKITPGQSHTSFFSNLSSLNKKYGALANIEPYVNRNVLLRTQVDKADKTARLISANEPFQAGILGQSVGAVGGAVVGTIAGAGTEIGLFGGMAAGSVIGSQLGKFSYQTVRAIQAATRARLNKAATAYRFSSQAAAFTGKIKRDLVELAANDRSIVAITQMIRSSPQYGPAIASYFPFMSDRDQESILYSLMQDPYNAASFEDPEIPGAISMVGRRLQDPAEVESWKFQLKEMRINKELTPELYQKAISALNRDGTLLVDEIFDIEKLKAATNSREKLKSKKTKTVKTGIGDQERKEATTYPSEE